MKLLLIHLSDLHIKNTIEYEDDKVRSIKEIIGHHKDAKDVLFLFTGDIAFSGEISQYKAASSFIEKIRQAVDADYGAEDGVHTWFAICPGNHDRKMQKEMTASDLESINLENFRGKLEENKLLESNYRGFQKTVCPAEKINEMLCRYTYDLDGQRCRIYSLNNSLLSAFTPSSKSAYDANKGKIYLPRELLDIHRANEELSILMMHIPFDFLCEQTMKELRSICEENIDFVFCGHTHDAQTLLVKHGENSLIEFVAPALHFAGGSGFCCLEIDGNDIYKFTHSFNTDDREYVKNDDEDAFSFNKKESTAFNQNIQKEFEQEISTIKLDSRHSFEWEKIFVFPLLTVDRYGSSQSSVESFEQFEEKRRKYDAVCISASHGEGKTTLAHALFHYYIDEGYCPILIDGSSVRSSAKHAIRVALKDIYSNKNIQVSYERTPKDKRVILIDNFEKATDKLIADFCEEAGNVIYFCNSDDSLTHLLDDSETVSLVRLKIDSFFYNKRIVLLGKIYEALCPNYSFIQDNFTKESFENYFEQTLTKLDSLNSLDANAVSLLAVQILTKVDVFQSDSTRSLFHFTIKAKIQDALDEAKYQYCDVKIAERLLADIAFRMYHERKNVFDETDLKQALQREVELRGGEPPIRTPNTYLVVLERHQILKRNENGYMFYNRSIFAYFIGKRAIERFHSSDADRSCLDEIIANGIYTPLNFQILLSIATVYDYEAIPQFFVRNLYPIVEKGEEIHPDSLKSLGGQFDKKKSQLLKITKKEREDFAKRRGRAEEKSRHDYIRNIDNYFYEEKVSENLRQIIEWANRMQIVSVLLNSFASDLRKAEKEMLVSMSIKLPNIVLRLLVEQAISSLDDFFIMTKNSLEKEEGGNAKFEEIRDFILSTINSFVLAIYDLGSRPLNNKIIVDQLDDALKTNVKVSGQIQRLMLLSFSNKTETFIKEATKVINGDDEYLARCARLIGRRFCLEHFEDINTEQAAFVSLVYHGKSSSLITDKAKKDGFKKPQ